MFGVRRACLPTGSSSELVALSSLLRKQIPWLTRYSVAPLQKQEELKLGVGFPQPMWERERPGPARNDTRLKRLPLLTRLSVPLHPPIPLCVCSGHTSWVCAARSRLASHYMPANTSTS